jgi:hypothetical protein
MGPQIHLLTAHVKLLHMATYSETMIRMMSYGLLKASQDKDYYRDSVKQAAPHLEGEKLEEVTGLKQELDLDSAFKGAKAACLIEKRGQSPLIAEKRGQSRMALT